VEDGVASAVLGVEENGCGRPGVYEEKKRTTVGGRRWKKSTKIIQKGEGVGERVGTHK